MGGKNVKNTMVERVLAGVAPHPCFGCGKLGTPLCIDCKYDIISDPFMGCIACARPASSGVCENHKYDIERAFVPGVRSAALEATINGLKFHHTKAAAYDLALLLHYYLPILPSSVRLVPVPTAPAHVRQRGYDQVELITRHLAALRGLPIDRVLRRQNTKTQHSVGRTDRFLQAKGAYSVGFKRLIDPNVIYLVVDDVITTSATAYAAAKAISDAGGRVWVAALAYQPLD